MPSPDSRLASPATSRAHRHLKTKLCAVSLVGFGSELSASFLCSRRCTGDGSGELDCSVGCMPVTSSTVQPASRTALALVLIDGLGDINLPSLGHRTPLQAAHTPALDAIAGRTGGNKAALLVSYGPAHKPDGGACPLPVLRLQAATSVSAYSSAQLHLPQTAYPR